jgi:hypothetical protein
LDVPIVSFLKFYQTILLSREAGLSGRSDTRCNPSLDPNQYPNPYPNKIFSDSDKNFGFGSATLQEIDSKTEEKWTAQDGVSTVDARPYVTERYLPGILHQISKHYNLQLLTVFPV